MLLLLPKYRPLVKRIDPIKRHIQVWNDDACEELRGCFECTDWSVFFDACDDVDELNDCVTEYVKYCENLVCERKEVVCYANNKPWVTKELKTLLNQKKYIFAKGNKLELKSKQREIKKEIVRCKEKYKEKLESCFYSGKIKETWKSLKTIINWTQKKTATPDNINLDELNKFYSRFDLVDNSQEIEEFRKYLDESTSADCEIVLSEEDTKNIFSKLNERKSPGPDGISGKMLKMCCEQLCHVYTYIFNLSLIYSSIPKMWKTSEIVPIPKKDKISTINDLRPIALTSIVMKCFEKLILSKIKAQTKNILDPHQFAYQSKRSVEDALLVFTNNIYKHLDTPKTYCRILFVDFSSAFNTIQPLDLVRKLCDTKMNKTLIAWVLDFMTGREQYVKVRGEKSDIITTNTGAPQGCVISPMLFILHTNDCLSYSPQVPLLKFADDTTLQGMITEDDESTYREEVDQFVSWCGKNHLELNVSKTKELIIDFRRNKNIKEDLIIKGEKIEQVNCYKYLGVTIDSNLQWNEHAKVVKNKMNRRMYFLRKLGQLKVDRDLCTLFFKSVIQSVLVFCIAAWGGNCNKSDINNLDKIIRRAEKFTNELQTFDTLRAEFCFRKICLILEENDHPMNNEINLSNRSSRILSIRTKTQRHFKSFLPSSIRIFNSKL